MSFSISFVRQTLRVQAQGVILKQILKKTKHKASHI